MTALVALTREPAGVGNGRAQQLGSHGQEVFIERERVGDTDPLVEVVQPVHVGKFLVAGRIDTKFLAERL